MNALCAVQDCGRPTQDVICGNHLDELVSALRAVADGLWDELEVTLTRQHCLSSVPSDRRSAETPVVFSEAASEARRSLRRFVWYWAYAFWGGNDHLAAPPADVPAACRWMASFPGLIASLPDAGSMWEDITRETRNAVRVVDRPPVLAYFGRCGAVLDIGSCEQHLYAPKGKATVKCFGCGTRWDASERQDSLVAQVADRLVGATAVSRLLSAIGVEIAASTVRTYAQVRMVQGLELPPRLIAKGRDNRGRPTYRVGDVLDLFLANQERHAA